MNLPKARDVADLLRLPAVLSVPGDVFLGAATSGKKRSPAETAGLTAASCCLYLAGMALNDYADRGIDAVERPKRPIPSGRVEPGFALGLASGLTAAGLGLALASGGRRSLGVAVPLAATVWAYDLALKETPLGPAAMAAARFLDVMMGSGSLKGRATMPAAVVVGGHIFLITTVSRQEARGGTRPLALGALVGSAAVTVVAARIPGRKTAGPLVRRMGRAASLGLLGAHAISMAAAEIAAIRDPRAKNLQRVVGAGILGLMPLEGGMLAASGAMGRAAAIAAAWPLARHLARKRSVT